LHPVEARRILMDMTPTRRSFLRNTLLGATGLLLGDGMLPAIAAIARGPQRFATGFGPLVPDPAGLLDLPAGFHYKLLSPGLLASQKSLGDRFQSTLSNGDPTPGLHDGMGAFAGPDGGTILVRNHEMNLGDGPAVDPARVRPYDAKLSGGTTTLWVDRHGNLTKSFASLSGTSRNCAGGVTPWGTWLTAEEAVYLPGRPDGHNADLDEGVAERHGYVFEVDARHEGLSAPVPLKAMGRFRHEAVAVDPVTGYAYLTEDREDGLFYRFRPAVLEQGRRPRDLRAGDLAKGGVLEALRVPSRPGLMAHNRAGVALTPQGPGLAVDWVRIADPDPDMDMEHPPGDPQGYRTAATATRAQGYALGRTQFERSEGIAYARGSVYFCCTNGGPRALGQVFRLDLRTQTLTLVVEPDEHAVLDGPDNLCVAHSGDLVVCEDNLAQRENFLVGITPTGRSYRIARNAHPSRRELAGACFSADGRTLFVNVQEPGMTFAIRGPWEKRRDD
jgi:hypothetical protein